MEYKHLQVENGNFTRIINPLIDALIKVPFKGCELAVAFFIIRKTYGFNKKEDEISLSQFENGIKKTRPSVVKALKNLKLVNIAKLVKTGNSKKQSNTWAINKYIDTWELVKTAKLVKHRKPTSKAAHKELVKAALHTKDIKDRVKDIAEQSSAEIPLVINAFKEVNPSYQKLFGNTTQRKACDRLLKTHGLDLLLSMIAFLPKSNSNKFAPKITTPLQFEDKLGLLKAWADGEKEQTKGRGIIGLTR